MKEILLMVVFVVGMDVLYDHAPYLAITIGIAAAIYAINDTFG
jgi:hypothetical protein